MIHVIFNIYLTHLQSRSYASISALLESKLLGILNSLLRWKLLLRKILFTILLFTMLGNISFADDIDMEFYGKKIPWPFGDNSYIPTISIFTAIRDTVTSLGATLAYNIGFSSTGSEDEGQLVDPTNSGAGYIPRGIIATNDMRWRYSNLYGQVYHKQSCDGDSWYNWQSLTFLETFNRGDKVCVGYTWVEGLTSMGCKYRPQTIKPSPLLTNVDNMKRTDSCGVTQDALSGPEFTPSCVIGSSCTNPMYLHSKIPFGLSSPTIQCIKESLDNVFNGVTSPGSKCASNSAEFSGFLPFAAFQANLRKTVKAALLLYLTLFALKIVVSSEVPQKSELATFLMKFILVLYFSVGIRGPIIHTPPPNTSVTTQISQDFYSPTISTVQYRDGVSQLIRPFFTSFMADLSAMIYEAAGSNLCKFNEAKDGVGSYPPGYDFLSLFDGIDCRILYYLGFDSANIKAMIITASEIIFIGYMEFQLFSMALMAMFSFNLIYGIFSIIFAILCLSIAVHIVVLYAMALIIINILIYFAPVFVPMALFSRTKGFFDAWLRGVFGYSVYPALAIAFITLMFTVFDKTMYGPCEFKNVPLFILGIDNTQYFGSEINVPDDPDDAFKCRSTMGFKISAMARAASNADAAEILNAIFFSILSLSPGFILETFFSMLTIALFAILFYAFASVLPSIMDDLLELQFGSMAPNPQGAMNRAVDTAKAAYYYAKGDHVAAARSAEKAFRGRGKTSHLDKNPPKEKEAGNATITKDLEKNPSKESGNATITKDSENITPAIPPKKS